MAENVTNDTPMWEDGNINWRNLDVHALASRLKCDNIWTHVEATRPSVTGTYINHSGITVIANTKTIVALRYPTTGILVRTRASDNSFAHITLKSGTATLTPPPNTTFVSVKCVAITKVCNLVNYSLSTDHISKELVVQVKDGKFHEYEVESCHILSVPLLLDGFTFGSDRIIFFQNKRSLALLCPQCGASYDRLSTLAQHINLPIDKHAISVFALPNKWTALPLRTQGQARARARSRPQLTLVQRYGAT